MMQPPVAIVSNHYGESRMLDVVRDAIRTADGIDVSVSFLRYSGLGLLADELTDFGVRGGRARFLTSTYLGVTQPEALRSLQGFRAVEARLFIHGNSAATPGFHTKLYVFRGSRRECWVGSSNFTKGGLATNIEANLRHVGAREVGQAEALFGELWDCPDTLPLDDRLIAWYEASRPRQAGFFAPPAPVLPAVADDPGPYPRAPAPAHPGSEPGRGPMPNAAQQEALARLAALRSSGESRAAVIAAPGVGKTYLAAFDAWAAGAHTVLFLSHRLEHLTQAERTFRAVFGSSFSCGKLFEGGRGGQTDLVFGTIRSASSDAAIASRRFDYVVVDEFHHAAAPSYGRLLARLRPGFLLGLTATPERRDGHDVLRFCDFNVAYEVRLVEAINRGWLLPFHYFGVADESVDYARIPWRSGGFDPEALENALMVGERIDAMLRHCRERGFDGPRRATVGFCAGVRHAAYMANALNERGLVAECVTGATEVAERERVYRRFADPDNPLEWLFVADVLNEGVDIPAINSLVFLRPTESSTIFIQQLGRGLRPSPGCEVLTVLDFVGHHRNAWLTMEALRDRDAPPGPSTIEELDLTPPRACEVVLDVRTREILEKIRRQSVSRKDACLAAYRWLKTGLGIKRPYPVDLLAYPDSPSLGDVRSSCGSWIGLRVAADDAEPWEEALAEGDPAFQLLAAAERDWQAQRVYAYAALWGMCARPEDPERGYEAFFDRFPRWKVEYKPLGQSKAAATLSRKLGSLYDDGLLVPGALHGIPHEELLHELEGRLQFVLEKDYRMRHGGILRRPGDLVLHRQYDRPDLVNHFGEQYDPARHNLGVLPFGDGPAHIAILTKLDTSDAIERHQYSNRFASASTFVWTSQNRQTQENDAGRMILDHAQRRIRLHLFVQPASHARSVYCGAVTATGARGNAPMEVTFHLHAPVTDPVLEQLGATFAQDRNPVS